MTGVVGGESTTVTGTVITITDDDEALPTVSLSLSPTSIREDGGESTVTATLTGALSEAVTVTVSAEPVSPAVAGDITLSTNKKLTIAAGETTSTGAVTIVANDNDVVEANKTVTVSGTVNGGNGVAAPSSKTLTITEDDTAMLSLDPATVRVAEGSKAAFTVKLTGAAASESTFSWATADGTASSGADYTAQTPTSITIGAGSTTATLEVQTMLDELVEGDETFEVQISAGTLPTGVTLGTATATATITDKDPITVNVSGPASVAEGEATAAYTVSLSPSGVTPTADLTVDYTTVDGTAQAGSDYTAEVGTLTFTPAAPGPQTVTVQTTGDTVVEGDETFKLTISNASGGGGAPPKLGTATVTTTITDDDAAPTGITLSVSPSAVTENGGAETVTVTAAVDGGTQYAEEKTVTVTVGSGSDSATEGTDYASVGELSITIAAEAASGTEIFTLTPTDDDLYEGDEEVSISGTFEVPVTGTVLTIEDDDEKPWFSIADTTAMEGKTANFAVTRGGATGNVVHVSWTTAEDTDGAHPASTSDYVPVTVPQTLNFAAGETEKIVRVRTNQDIVDEPNETFLVRLSGPSSNAEIVDGEAVGTIINDDPPPEMSIEDAEPVMEGDTARFPVRLSIHSGRTITVGLDDGVGNGDGGSGLRCGRRHAHDRCGECNRHDRGGDDRRHRDRE